MMGDGFEKAQIHDIDAPSPMPEHVIIAVGDS